MDPQSCIQLIIIIILLLLSAFFSSAETALTMVNVIRIKTLAEAGNRNAKTVLKVIEDSGKMLSAILIGNNLVNLSASALVTSFTMGLWGNLGVSIATGVLTLVVLIFGEITPKTMAAIESEKISFRYAPIIYGLMVILTPIIFVVNKISLAFISMSGVDKDKAKKVMTEREIRFMMEESKDDGEIEDTEYEMIDNVFDFGDSKAKDVMIPRIDISFVQVDSTYDELISIYAKDLYTRYPVYGESQDKIMGFINIKDLLLCRDTGSFNVRDYLREPYYTYENKNTAELLEEMRRDTSSYSIVLDEYGCVAGLITVEDLLEEIVGEIRDEYDDDEIDDIEKVSEEEYVVTGSAKLDDVNEELGINLLSEDYDNIAGYILECLEELPKEGDIILDEKGNKFTIVAMEKNRIDTVSIKPNITDNK